MAVRDFTLQPLQFDTTDFDEFHALLSNLVWGNRRLMYWVDGNRNSIGDKFASFSYGDRLRLLNILRHHTKFEEIMCERLREFIIGRLDIFLQSLRSSPGIIFLQRLPRRPDNSFSSTVFVHLLAWADLRDEIIISLWTSAEKHTGLFDRWLRFQDRHIIDLIDGIITRNVSPMSMSLHHTSGGGDITFTSNMSNTHLDSISSPQFQSLGSIHSTHDNGCRLYSGLRPTVAHIVHNNDGTLSQSHVSISEFMPNSLPNNFATASLQSRSLRPGESDMSNIRPPYRGIIRTFHGMPSNIVHNSDDTDLSQSHISIPKFMPNSIPNNVATASLQSRPLRPGESDMSNIRPPYRGIIRTFPDMMSNNGRINDGTLSQSHISRPVFMPNSLPNNAAIASPESDMRNINPPYRGTRITQSHILTLEFMPNSPPNNAASTLESRSLRPVESDDNPSGLDGEFSSGHTEEARVTTDDETARYSKLFRTVFSSLLTTIFPVFNILKPDSWRSKPLSIKVSAYLTGTFAAAAVLSSLVGVALTNLQPYILPFYRNPQLERNILKGAVHSTAYAFIGTMCHLFLQDDPLIMWIVACISYAAFTAIMYFLGRGR